MNALRCQMNILLRYPLASFLLLAIGISWALAAGAQFISQPTARLALDTAAKFGPSLAALVVVAANDGITAVGKLLTSLRPGNLKVRWFAVAIFAPLILWSVAIVVWQFGGGAQLYVEPTAVLAFLPLFAQRFFLGGGLGEELGWRGFALPRLLERHSPLVASLLLGLCWGLWHAPAFWGIAPGKQGGAPMLALFTIYTVALSIVFTWFWLRNGGSLLFSCLFHASLNTSENWIKALAPPVADSSAPTLIYATVILLLAVGIGVGWLLHGTGEDVGPQESSKDRAWQL